MATTILRKVWETVRPNSASSSTRSNSDRLIYSNNNNDVNSSNSSGGALDRIPLDILYQILKVIGPKESAKLSAVCKYLRFVVSENRLWVYFLQDNWDSIFFGETHLRSGFHLPQYVYAYYIIVFVLVNSIFHISFEFIVVVFG